MIQKRKKNKAIPFYSIIIFLSNSAILLAQDEDGPDPPPAPIDDYLYHFIIVALFIALFVIYNSERYKINKSIHKKNYDEK